MKEIRLRLLWVLGNNVRMKTGITRIDLYSLLKMTAISENIFTDSNEQTAETKLDESE